MYSATAGSTSPAIGSPSFTRSRTIDEEISTSGIFRNATSARSGASARSTSSRPASSRSATARSASSTSACGSRHAGSVRAISAPTMNVSSASGSAVMDRSQGIHRIGRPAALDLQAAGLAARPSPPTASRHISRRRSGPGSSRSPLCGALFAGISSTRSKPSSVFACLASARCPRWGGLNVPPRMPIADRS